MKTATIVIQARMGSRRFPGKICAPLRGKLLIEHVLQAAIRAGPYEIILATSDANENHILRHIAIEYNARFYAGSDSDVLERFRAAVPYTNGPVCRLTADCPLVDHRTIQELVEAFSQRNVPYLGRRMSPDGDDCEVFKYSTLLTAAALATEKYDREHVCPYMRRMPGALEWTRPMHVEDAKYSVDEVDDLHVCEALLDECGEGATCQQYVEAYRKLYVSID